MFDSGEPIDPKYTRRREIVFIVLSGIFLGTLAMLNLLGITRLIDLSFTFFGIEIPFKVFVGVLPYPITFLCTDFISELYGKKRANTVVWVGLLLNLWVLFIMWVGGKLPPHPHIIPETGLPPLDDPNRVFFEVQMLTKAATAASMIAYLSAQFVDVHIFHFLKKITKGKHMWIRNNGSTLTSQMVDSLAVISITYFYTHAIQIPEGESVMGILTMLILSNYIFKLTAALLDTAPFYMGTKILSKYLMINPVKEFEKYN
ncbi:MAG: queuosine precursor transporter [Bacteroidales bacterium]|nr:queuosine precursor transporter [Bacteroidales bacterium]